jgi:hypothetical protein
MPMVTGPRGCGSPVYPGQLVAGAGQADPAILGNGQRRQVPARLIVFGHDARPGQGKPGHAP